MGDLQFFWRCLCQPIDIRLSNLSESGLRIWYVEVEIRLPLFDVLTLARALAQSDTEWELLFQRSLCRLQECIKDCMAMRRILILSGRAETRPWGMGGIDWGERGPATLSVGTNGRFSIRGIQIV